MRTTLIAITAALIGLFSFPLATSAATIILQNYFYAHANTVGTFPFKDKYSATVQYGDGVERDASIISFVVEAQGMESGDQIIAYSSGGTQWTVTPGQTTQVTISASQSLRIDLIKSGTNEVYARMSQMLAFDSDDGGVQVQYVYSVNDMPTEYGDLGPGTGSGGGTVQGFYNYIPEQDMYQYLYDKPTGSTRSELHFLDNLGNTMYKRDYDYAPTGIHYLTCNGTYQMRYFDGSTLAAQSPLMTTTKIQSPTCASYSGGENGFSDFYISQEPGVNDYTNVFWDDVAGAASYKVYKDGQHLMDIPAGNSNPNGFSTAQDGHYSVIAIGGSGQTIGQADTVVGGEDNPTTPTDPGGGGECGDVCQKIRDQMACPEWDEYMGEWTNAIKNALPPPPNWDDIADKIGAATIRHLDNYMGDVPSVPTKEQISNEITPPLPPLDTSVPDVPLTVPSDFNSPMEFDITTGPEIPVLDESEPIEIYDPNKYIDSDEPGEMVFPGDPENHSDGIKQPDTIETGYTQPTPTIPDSEGPPPTDMPIPNGPPPTDMPIPNGPPPTDMPIPNASVTTGGETP